MDVILLMSNVFNINDPGNDIKDTRILDSWGGPQSKRDGILRHPTNGS
jgi:hypothetical protein